mgnify:CR=1 FL=1
MDTRFPFVDWFRNASPYINAHRGRTFVILIEGEAMASGRGEQLIQDLALLHTLGVRLVVVFGIRPQVHESLTAAGVEPTRVDGRWVADRAVMAHVEQVAAHQRLWLEARLSLGLPSTPLHGVELSVISGNLVTAKPLGVREGVDFDHSGEVRRVRASAIEGLLEKGSLVLLPPLGFSSTGEVFDLDASEVAQHAAVALKADKLILLGESEGLEDEQGALLRQLSPFEAEPRLQQAAPGSELDQARPEMVGAAGDQQQAERERAETQTGAQALPCGRRSSGSRHAHCTRRGPVGPGFSFSPRMPSRRATSE